jgi:hypothetical protein
VPVGDRPLPAWRFLASSQGAKEVGWRFDNTYSRLPDIFFVPATPATVREPRVSILSYGLAGDLGLDLIGEAIFSFRCRLRGLHWRNVRCDATPGRRGRR